MLHGLGGRLGGHSSLQLEGVGGVVAFVHEDERVNSGYMYVHASYLAGRVPRGASIK